MSVFKIEAFEGESDTLGVIHLREGSFNFCLHSPEATHVLLLIELPDSGYSFTFPMTSHKGRWHLKIKGIPFLTKYAYNISFPHHKCRVVDPYAKALDTPFSWGALCDYQKISGVLVDERFDWEGVTQPQIPQQDLVIYEMHVRSYTQSPTAKTQFRGTFLGMIEKLPYLKSLGINALELLPILEFNENETIVFPHRQQRQLVNYWGYSPLHFFAIHNRYGSGSSCDSALRDFKQLVKEAHKLNIEVILDVVFNHTGELFLRPPSFSLRSLSPFRYYLLQQGHDTNYSGCGNTLNINHPQTMSLCLESLVYFATQCRVDGFRFDLASVFTRNTDGSENKDPPFLKALVHHPILSRLKLIMEPWDGSGHYLLGNFPYQNHLCSWNDQFRTTTRKFLQGVPYTKEHFASCFTGSDFLFRHQGSPLHSLNYTTCHDGVSLYDLYSYSHKHNEANGEYNRDGNNQEHGRNGGCEGFTTNLPIQRWRRQQIKNSFVALLTAQGIPMILMGDEYGHTKQGNNNTWCQDNDLNWFCWNSSEDHKDLIAFVRDMISLRQSSPLFKQTHFLDPHYALWHGVEPFNPCWNRDNSYLGLSLHNETEAFYIGFNPTPFNISIELPSFSFIENWSLLVDTSRPSSFSIDLNNRSKKGVFKNYKLNDYSSIIFYSNKT